MSRDLLAGLRPDLLKMAERMHGYRFHGDQAPKRVANEVPSGPVENGVATLRLYDPIDSWGADWGVSAKEFTAALDALPADTHTIELHLNSPGGEVFDGIAILNALRNHDAKVVAVVDGIAASAASFIAAGADEVVMGRNSELMIHDARGVTIGNAADHQQMTDLLNHLSNNIAAVYQAKAGGTVDDWRAAMLAETWYSADEAAAAGLADRVEGQDTPENDIDLSAFNYAGREKAPAPDLSIAKCRCGHQGQPATAGMEHKDECPEKVTNRGTDERRARLQQRRHALNTRRAA